MRSEPFDLLAHLTLLLGQLFFFTFQRHEPCLKKRSLTGQLLFDNRLRLSVKRRILFDAYFGFIIALSAHSLLGDQEEIGRYLSCSMLSPVFEFKEHATAVAAAEEIMRLVLEPPQPAPDAADAGASAS